MAAAQYIAVTVQSSASGTQILAANNERRGVIIYNNGANVVYLGFDSNVTTSNGMPMMPQSSFTLTGDRCWRGIIRGIATSSTDDVRVWEWLS
jgi:hypothetical protein